MKNIFYLITLIALLGCSANKSYKKLSDIDIDTYRSSASIKEHSYKLIFNSVVTDADIIALNKLADQCIITKVGKISILPKTCSLGQSSIMNEACNKVIEIFLKRGIKESILDIQPININEINKENSIIIKFYTYKVLLPTVDRWKYNVGDIDVTKKLPNFGTAMSYNLGCMIANPRDLVDPAEYSKVDGKSAVTVIRKLIPVSTGGGMMGSGGGLGSLGTSSGNVSASMPK